jgi:predicted metal-dependent enzyme (double-stranded beta helix superfamily)
MTFPAFGDANVPGGTAAAVAWSSFTPKALAPWAAELRADLQAASATDFQDVVVSRTAQLLNEFDLSGAGVPRQGRHTGRSWWLYYDGSLSVIGAIMDKGEVIAAHNHGNWNVTGVWKGALEYESYERVDGGDIPLRAELRLRTSCIVGPSEAILCPPPPHDIHRVTCVEDAITVLVAPPFASEREYYDVKAHSYVRQSEDSANYGMPSSRTQA